MSGGRDVLSLAPPGKPEVVGLRDGETDPDGVDERNRVQEGGFVAAHQVAWTDQAPPDESVQRGGWCSSRDPVPPAPRRPLPFPRSPRPGVRVGAVDVHFRSQGLFRSCWGTACPGQRRETGHILSSLVEACPGLFDLGLGHGELSHGARPFRFIGLAVDHVKDLVLFNLPSFLKELLFQETSRAPAVPRSPWPRCGPPGPGRGGPSSPGPAPPIRQEPARAPRLFSSLCFRRSQKTPISPVSSRTHENTRLRLLHVSTGVT